MSRRFFSGRSLQAAVLSAAAKFNLEPDELAYEEIDKRHGLLKNRGKVVIAVDPDQPRKEAGGGGAPARDEAKAEKAEPPSRRKAAPAEAAKDAEEEDAPAEGGEDESAEADKTEAEAPEPSEKKPAKRPRRRSRRTAPEVEDEAVEAEPAVEEEAEPAEAEAEDAEPEEPVRPRRRRARGRREEPAEAEAEEPRRARGAREERDEEPDREEPEEADDERPRPSRQAEGRKERDERKDRGRGPERAEREGLVELPDRPRSLADRYPRARGPLARAAKQGVEAIAALAGLDVQAEVFEGDDRLEIDLSGPHHALLVAEDGELLVAIEHLLPRVMRGFGGETAAVRVDCENFQEIREERLRNYAQVVAGEVRRSGRSRNLDPLSPSDRRIVHLTVADEPGVESESEGSGYLKRVRVSPA